MTQGFKTGFLVAQLFDGRCAYFITTGGEQGIHRRVQYLKVEPCNSSAGLASEQGA